MGSCGNDDHQLLAVIAQLQITANKNCFGLASMCVSHTKYSRWCVSHTSKIQHAVIHLEEVYVCKHKDPLKFVFLF